MPCTGRSTSGALLAGLAPVKADIRPLNIIKFWNNPDRGEGNKTGSQNRAEPEVPRDYGPRILQTDVSAHFSDHLIDD